MIILMIVAAHILSPSIAGPIDELIDWNNANGNQIKILEGNYNSKTVRYLYRASTKENPLLVFIHGAPGSWDAFKTFLLDDRLADEYSMISIDRLGYGESDRGNYASIQDQTKMLHTILENYPTQDLIMVGHSYGAPIAATYESIYQDASALVLLAPVVDPDNERLFWFAYPAHWKLTRWMFPDWIKVSTMEKFKHAEELVGIRHIWSQLNKPIIHVHAEDDWIAPGKENISFLKRNVKDEFLIQEIRENKGHLIPWNDYDFIVKTFLDLSIEN